METSKFHLSLFVSDIDKTIQFYTRLFGFEPVKTKSDYTKFELDNPGLVISFIESGDKVSPQFGHLGFRVSNDAELEKKKSELSQYLEIELEEQNVACCYAKQNKFWVNDPDGYEWEVYHFIEDVEQNEPKYSAAPCC
ncbi:ArsI/CadI family heavy metal resistance metalloenzyme [Marinoscillum sp. MHG1-6]|uniref:ArsI/CadI family heavy metal resistance metalloenzyme n=1 Tax=Marinoscillum sp. MHG1-6 TaxID=2959627 RepID=UPI0021582F61|nr:ArsI/CadI family heavy metal resistance metalloenzyme [Marinoscillum sp. MHG1-6]